MENEKNNINDYKNDIQSKISHSGNSNVDVQVTVETTSIAYAMLCSLLATKQISNNEFHNAIRKLNDLTHKNKRPSFEELNDISQVKLFKNS